MIKWAVRIVGALATLAIVVLVGGYFYFIARPHPADPLEARISYDDLTTFISVHQEAQANDDAAAVYAAEYFDRDSRPVDTYVSMFSMSAEQVAIDAQDRPELYARLLADTADVVATEPKIRAAYAEFKKRYAAAVFFPIYILYGNFHARALIQPYGILYGGEYFIGDNNVDDLTDPHSLNGLMNRPAKLASQVIHELAHIQQARKHPLVPFFRGDLLKWAVTEGTADFVAMLITGSHTRQAAHAFLVDNKDAKWCAFIEAVESDRGREWLDQSVFADHPNGIGPAFGYQMVKAYYEGGDNKDAMFTALVELDDYRRIYEESGFSARLTTMCR
jgi:hypothetical protein